MAVSTSHALQLIVFAATIFASSGRGGLLLSADENGLSNHCFRSLVHFVHLASCALLLGITLWVSFFAGVIKFHTLPRHQFGYIQSKLFPAYFSTTSFLSFLAVVSFHLCKPYTLWSRADLVQAFSLYTVFTSSTFNQVLLEPFTTMIMFELHKMEKENGLGEAIGRFDVSLMKENAKYIQMRKKFLWLHIMSVLVNLAGFAAMGFHLWHLALNLQRL